MRADSLTFVQGSTLSNAAIDYGSVFPQSPIAGQLFFYTLSGSKGLWVYDGGSWVPATATPLPLPISVVQTSSALNATQAPLPAYQGMVIASNDLPLTITVPPASEVQFLVGTNITVVQGLKGQVTIVGGNGVTVNTASTLKTRTIFSALTLVCVDTNSWLVFGDAA